MHAGQLSLTLSDVIVLLAGGVGGGVRSLPFLRKFFDFFRFSGKFIAFVGFRRILSLTPPLLFAFTQRHCSLSPYVYVLNE